LSAADLARLCGDATVADEFLISVRVPLKHQAEALLRLRQIMNDVEGLSLELGTVALG
jgi:hypothetical protein